MAEPDILIKFDGGDADQNAVDMRLLGASLQGFDRIISDGVILLSAKRLPKRGERAPLIVKAQAPKPGSQEIWAFLQENAGLLPLGWQLAVDGAGNIVWHWVSFALKYFGGGRDAAASHLAAIIELQKLQSKERLKMEEMHVNERAEADKRHLEAEADFRRLAFELIGKLAVPAASAVSPVGPSVRKVNFASGGSAQTEVDEPMAENIRAKGVFDVGEMQTMDLRVDGIVHHNRKLNVEHPSEPGRYISADVRDPLFQEIPNPYTDAVACKGLIRVQVKPAYRAGVLERLYIMDFQSKIEEAA